MKNILKNSIKEGLREWIETFPEDIPEFMEVITGQMHLYKIKVDKDRDRKASEAVHNMFMHINTKKDLKTTQKKDKFILWHIEAMFIRFPNGRKTASVGTSVDKDIFNYYEALCREVDYFTHHGDFIKQTRGEDVYNWLKNICEVK